MSAHFGMLHVVHGSMLCSWPESPQSLYGLCFWQWVLAATVRTPWERMRTSLAAAAAAAL